MAASALNSQTAHSSPLADALRALCHWQRLARETGRWLEGELAGQGVAGSELLLAWLVGGELAAGQPQQAIAEAAGLSAAQTSVCLEKLRRAGWLESRRSPHDRRQQLWQLTPRGHEHLARVMQHLATRLNEGNCRPSLRLHDPASQLGSLSQRPATEAAEAPT